MAGLFGPKGAAHVNTLSRLLTQLDSEEESEEAKARARSRIPEVIHKIHFLLYGNTDTPPDPKQIEKLAPRLLEEDVFGKMTRHIHLFDFEARKQAAGIMKFLIRRSSNNSCVEYIRAHEEVTAELFSKYTLQELAQNIGSIIQEMAKRPDLCEMLLQNDHVMETLFELVKKPNFDIASDAFKTLQIMLTRDGNRAIVSDYLENNFGYFFGQINALVRSDNYVTQRQFLKLLGELLMERTNRKIMMAYINEKENLKILMTLLKNPSKAIAYESFHIFKIFVANPKKARAIQIVLFKNRNKLLDFIRGFQCERDEDEQFAEDKRLVVEKLSQLEPPEDVVLEEKDADDEDVGGVVVDDGNDGSVDQVGGAVEEGDVDPNARAEITGNGDHISTETRDNESNDVQ